MSLKPFLYLAIFFYSFTAKAQAVDTQDSLALVDLYNSTNGDGWYNNAGWLTQYPVNTWQGVTVQGSRVTKIVFYSNQLKGSLPSTLGNLTALTDLELVDGQLSGTLPSTLGNLVNLTALILNKNSLTGTIPAALENLTNLQVLSLYQNQLSGYIPSFTRLTNLTGLFLGNNFFKGTIPPELGNLVQLRQIDLKANQLTGVIPVSLGNLINLESLDLSSNQLTGVVPALLGNLTNMRYLILSSNQLTGSIPQELGNLVNLNSIFSLSNNQLSGTIPATLGNLVNLNELDLSNNKLSGAIPANLGNLTNILAIRLKNNQLTGSIPPELGSLSLYFSTLDLSNNQLTGTLPAMLGKPGSFLSNLYLNNNQLKGNIPASFGNLANLNNFYLGNNQLSGAAPMVLSNLTFLSNLSLANNNFTFTVLEFLPKVRNSLLYAPQATIPLIKRGSTLMVFAGGTPANDTFRLYRNNVLQKTQVADSVFSITANGKYYIKVTNAIAKMLTLSSDTVSYSVSPQDSLALVNLFDSTTGKGWFNNTNWLTSAPVSNWFGVKVSNGRVVGLQLSGNNLKGYIPHNIGNLTGLNFLFLGTNIIRGSLPDELGNLVNLNTLIVNNNQLVGNIPSSIGNLLQLADLELAINNLSGSIPASLGSLSNLTVLALWQNKLSGSIPSSLGKLKNLTTLGLNTNMLNGALPAALGNLTNLLSLNVSYNQLTGSIPAEIGSLGALNDLELNQNQLSGLIPPELSKLTQLTILILSNNLLSNNLPPLIGNLVHLRTLDVSSNQLSGPVPMSLSNIPGLQFVSLRDNKFTFNGMESLPGAYTVIYAPQAAIPLVKNSVELSVSAGGTPANDTFRLYKNGVLIKTQVADSIFVISTTGRYNIKTTNALATNLTLYSDTLDVATLPLTLLSFTGKQEHNGILLQWQTIDEVNTKGFTVEHSSNGSIYTPLAQINAIGNAGTNNYRFADANTFAGKNYYRLKLEDKNGQFTYSKIIFINAEERKSALSLYPNPTKNIARLMFNSTSTGRYVIIIANMAGKQVKCFNGVAVPGVNNIMLDVTGFVKGVYIVTVNTVESGVQAFKLVIQ